MSMNQEEARLVIKGVMEILEGLDRWREEFLQEFTSTYCRYCGSGLPCYCMKDE